MSLTGALFTGVTGLNAQSQQMAAISDNLANINTTGYKRVVSRFSTLVTDGSSANTFSPGGVRANPTALVRQQGLVSTSESGTDLALSGAGFFVVNPLSSGTGTFNYTRAGSFTPDFTGNLRNAGGYFLQGWPLDANGNIPASSADLSSLQTINVQQVSGVAASTTQIGLGMNLDATQTVDGVYALNDISGGVGTAQFFRNFSVFDSLGTKHELQVAYVKTGVNEWAVEIFATTAADVVAANGLLGSGRVAFNGDGTLDANNTLGVASPIGTVNVLTGALEVTLTPVWTNGSLPGSITLDLGIDDQNSGLTQFASNYNVAFVNQNGSLVGQLNDINVDSDGFVIASFSNGQTQRIFKVPVATFADPNSLRAETGNAYTETDTSGSFNLREAGTGGAANLVPSALEAANVDIAKEFTNMIVTQRAFSANTRVIITADEMLEELIRLA